MSQAESKLSNEIKKALRLQGAWCIKIHGSEYMEVGTPDLVGCYKGKFFAFETKLPQSRANVSLAQERQMEKIRQAHGVTAVVCSVNEAISILRSIE